MARSPTTHPVAARSRAVEPALIGLAYLFVLVALAGFATFGLHPQWVASVPGAARAYGVVYANVGQAQVWLLWTILAVVLFRRTGVEWLPAFAAVYVLSFLSEFLGTSYGVPFGGYAYSDLLGPKWFARVPFVIPLSWFAMTIPAFALAGAPGAPRGRLTRVLLAAAFLVAWDLALDPAMSALTPYWIWSEAGPYYGMPWVNLLGWYLTAVLLMGSLTVLRAERWIDRLPLPWLGAYYGANLLMPLGMLAAAGMWLGVVTTLAALALLFGIAFTSARRVPGLLPVSADVRP